MMPHLTKSIPIYTILDYVCKTLWDLLMMKDINFLMFCIDVLIFCTHLMMFCIDFFDHFPNLYVYFQTIFLNYYFWTLDCPNLVRYGKMHSCIIFNKIWICLKIILSFKFALKRKFSFLINFCPSKIQDCAILWKKNLIMLGSLSNVKYCNIVHSPI